MKRNALLALSFLAVALFASCSKNKIVPVSGTIGGKPAISLYGSSGKATDYVLIDTAAADKKLSYDGIVFSYVYNSASSNIYILNAGIPAADGVLTLSGPHIALSITSTYSLTFGSSLYTSN